MIEKETLDILQIIDVLGERPYDYPESIVSYIKEIRKGEKEKMEKKEKDEKIAAESIIVKETNDLNNNNTGNTDNSSDKDNKKSNENADKENKIIKSESGKFKKSLLDSFPNFNKNGPNLAFFNNVKGLISYVSSIISHFKTSVVGRRNKNGKKLKKEFNNYL